MTQGVAIDLDGVLGDTRPLWNDFLEEAARRYESISRLPVSELASDRVEAAAELDCWAKGGVGDWQGALERFAEERAPVYLRPRSETNAALRRLRAAGWRVGVYTDAPAPLAHVALAHLGVTRHIDEVAAGLDARTRIVEQIGPNAQVAETPEELAKIATDG